MDRSVCRRAVAVSAFCVAVALGCRAQEAADVAEASIEELGRIKVYTASKHLQSGTDAPSSVTVITADEIQKHGYRTLADILQTVRGFFVTYDRNYSSLGVRGFARPGDFNTRVLLLVDGHRLNDNIYDEAMLGTEFPIDIDLISRIEVVRGPVSSLYGSNALFAVINIITKRGPDVRGLELSAEAASFNSYKGRMSYGGRQHGVDFLISGTFYGSRGVDRLFFPQLNAAETNFGIADHADDDQAASALSTLSFGDFTLQGVYGTREKGIPTGAYGTIFNNAGTRTTDSHGYLDLGYRHTFAGSWDVLARAFFDRYSYQGTYMYATQNNPASVNPNLDFGDGAWWGTELQVTKKVHRHRMTAGVEIRDNIRQNQANFDENPFALNLDDRRSSAAAGIYFQDEISLSKLFSLNAGVRYDRYTAGDGSTDPRAALIFRPTPVTALKFIYGESFRIPNVYEIYYSVAPNLPNPSLHPERMSSYEAGWEQGISQHLWFSASAFFNRMHKLITQVPTPDGALIFHNLQNVNSAGLELEVRTQLSQGLEATASYSFQETKDANSRAFLSDSPRHLAKLGASEPLFHKKLFFSLDAQYRSGIRSLESGRISPTTVLNATLFSRNLGKHLDVSGTVYNLLDRRYFDPPSSANLQLPIPQEGRSLRFKLTWHAGER
jgi:outer membrane receptor protein involved in Fe transport